MGPVVVIVSVRTECVCKDGRLLVLSTVSMTSKISSACERACLPSKR